MIQQIQQRDRTWDIVKGIGIILVVIAHTRDPLPLHRTIYLFHMGLFYFIGGYFLRVDYTMNAKHSVLLFIKKKITALYLPYVIVGSLLLLMNPLFVTLWTIDLPYMWIVYSIFGVAIPLVFRLFYNKSFQIIKSYANKNI